MAESNRRRAVVLEIAQYVLRRLGVESLTEQFLQCSEHCCKRDALEVEAEWVRLGEPCFVPAVQALAKALRDSAHGPLAHRFWYELYWAVVRLEPEDHGISWRAPFLGTFPVHHQALRNRTRDPEVVG